tara:strand:- start:269 stop:469 length:201 start_codon:yes stop_codon:yes gene_type:complete
LSNSYFYFALAVGVALGAWGSYMAERRNRSKNLGFLLGFLFGVIGLIIIMLLGSKKNQDYSEGQKN